MRSLIILISIPLLTFAQGVKSSSAGIPNNLTSVVGFSQTTVSGNSATQCLMSFPLPTSPFNAVGKTYFVYGEGSFTVGTGATTTWKLTISTATACGGSSVDLASVAYGTAMNTTGFWDIRGGFSVAQLGSSQTIYSWLAPNMNLTGGSYSTRLGDIGGTNSSVNTSTASYWVNFVVTSSGGTPTWNQKIGIVQQLAY